MLCFILDGQLKETHIDQQLSEIYAPVVDDCYALAEKNGLIYMLYYSYTVITAFDETGVKGSMNSLRFQMTGFGYAKMNIHCPSFRLMSVCRCKR